MPNPNSISRHSFGTGLGAILLTPPALAVTPIAKAYFDSVRSAGKAFITHRGRPLCLLHQSRPVRCAALRRLVLPLIHS